MKDFKDLTKDFSLILNTFDKAKNFFRPSLTDLHDPFLMQDMQKAVDRIQQAIKGNEKILVFGDYDVDGTTSVALVSSFLNKHLSDTVLTYIPDIILIVMNSMTIHCQSGIAK